MKAFYQMSYENVIKQFNSQINGLLNEEVYKQRENYGSNQIEEIKSVSPIIIFFSQFKDFLVIILMVAAGVSAMMGKLESTLVIISVLIHVKFRIHRTSALFILYGVISPMPTRALVGFLFFLILIFHGFLCSRIRAYCFAKFGKDSACPFVILLFGYKKSHRISDKIQNAGVRKTYGKKAVDRCNNKGDKRSHLSQCKDGE